MNRDVVEGNSTSLRSSTRFPNPQEPSALMDLSHLHMNDLGLTPFPGFQLGDSTLQDKEQHCSGDHEVINPAGCHDGIDQADGENVKHNVGVHTTDVECDPQSLDIFGLHDDSYDPLFDSAIPELESAFSRKRTADSQDLPPGKRQRLDSPSEAPSLTTDSTHESPASFFDTFDNLFGNGSDLPLPCPDDPLPNFEEATIQPTLSPPKTSDSTRERFLLDDQDILSSNIREILQVGKQPEYSSPYSVSEGPLGYLPSSPGIHVKSVAVGLTDQDREILNLQARLAQVTRERDQHKKSLLQYATLNDEGKCPEQVLREENVTLRRVSSRRQARIEECVKEAADWRNKLHAVSTLYNNLLYELKAGKQPIVASIPAGYKPPHEPFPVRAAPVQRQFDLVQNGNSALQSSVHSCPPGSNKPPASTATQHSNPEHQYQSVTIDLTEEHEAPPTPPSEPDPSAATLQSLRSKKYSWLPAGNDPSRCTRTSHSPAIDDDELAQMMEAELSRG
ncbi:uncharacterized protein BDV17DRAFT_259864 [Aspergillus undulatus]|uniref:uncharacterized protein n=1 Tax=Aspergillus undulatus TaxID=1810928 RepID=UPI003CCCBF37